MAKVVIEGDELILQLSFWEKMGALHTSPRAARSALTSVESVEQLWRSDVLRGIRAPGTVFPYVVLLGTLRGRRYKDFVAMKGRGQGCVLTFAVAPLSGGSSPSASLKAS